VTLRLRASLPQQEFSMSATAKAGVLPSLEFDDGRVPILGLEAVGQKLKDVGARLTSEPMPDMPESVARTIAGQGVIPSRVEQAEVMKLFALSAEECAAEIQKAGREPHFPGGGEVHPMLAFAPVTNMVNYMVNGLHINASKEGEGVDELVKFLRFTQNIRFFLVFPDGVCSMLTVPPPEQGRYWLWNFSSLMLHYVFLDPAGMYLHHSVGPHSKKMYFELEKLPRPAVSKIICPTDKFGTRPWGEYTIDKSVKEMLVRMAGIAGAYVSRVCV